MLLKKSKSKNIRARWTSAIIGLALAVSGLAVLFVAASPASAAAAQTLCNDALAGVTTNCPDKTDFPIDGNASGSFTPGKCYTIYDVTKGWATADCAGNAFKVIVPVQTPSPSADKAQNNDCPADISGGTQKCDLVKQFLNPIINGLSIVVVLAIIISIIIGGIQYSASADSPGAIAAARQRIINAVIALLAYLFLWSFLQWIIPGGLL